MLDKKQQQQHDQTDNNNNNNKKKFRRNRMRIPNSRAYSAIVSASSRPVAREKEVKITVDNKETHLFAAVGMKYKKPKLKPLHNNGNGILDDKQITKMDEKINNNKRKSKSPVTTILEKEPSLKKPKTENNEKVTKGIKDSKDSSDPTPIIKRSDSPGLDLSVFQPRGKRKCVIQNELKKQRTDDWWSDEDEDDEDDEIDDDSNTVNGGVANDRFNVNHHSHNNNNNHHHDDEDDDDEIEEEIPDVDDDDEQEVEIKDEDLSEEEIEDIDDDDDQIAPPPPPPPPPTPPQPTVIKYKQNATSTKKKNLTKQPSFERKTEKNAHNKKVANGNVITNKTVRCFVFSTAMANRAGHSVNKGMFTSISKYHDAQQWEMPYLSSELHCRPFDAALEDALAERENERQQQQRNSSTKELNNKNLSSKTTNDIDIKPTLKKEGKDTITKDITTKNSKKSDKKQQQQHNQQQSVKSERPNNNSNTVSPPRSSFISGALQPSSMSVVSSSSSNLGENEKGKVNPLHPRFHLLSGPTPPAPQNTSYSTKSNNGVIHNSSTVDTNGETLSRLSEKDRLSRLSPPPSSVNGGTVVVARTGVVATDAPVLQRKSSSPPHILGAPAGGVGEHRRHSNTPPVLVCSVPSKLPASSSTQQQHNNNNTVSAASSSWPLYEHVTNSNIQSSSSLLSSFPVEISNKKNHRSVNGTKEFAHLSPKEFGLHHKLLEKPLVSISPVSSYKEREPTALLGAAELQKGRTSLELAAEKVRMESSARLKGSPPVLPRDLPNSSHHHHHHSSAFISPRDRTRGGAPFNGFGTGGGGITPNGNALYNPLLRSHAASSPFPPSSIHHQQQHSRDMLLERESMVDFSRNSVIIPPPPVRLSVTRSTSNGNGNEPSKTYEDYVPLTSSAIHNLRKDRPASLPVSAESDVYSPNRCGENNNKEKSGKKHHSPPIHNSAFSVDSLTAKSRAPASRVEAVTSIASRIKEQQQRDEETTRARLLERHFPLPPSSHHHQHHRVIAPPPDSRIASQFPPPHPHSLYHEHLHMPSPHNGGIHNGLKRTLDEQLSTNLLHAEHRKYIEQMDWLRNKDSIANSKRFEFERLVAAGPHRTHPAGFPPVSSSSDLRSLYLSGHFPPAQHHRIQSNGHYRDLPSPPHHRLYSPYGRR